MKLTFLGADHEVTGSCHYLCVGDKNILIDCGMEQGNDVYENQELPIPASDVDFAIFFQRLQQPLVLTSASPTGA